MAKKLIIN